MVEFSAKGATNMSEEIAAVRNALVEAVTARKIIEQKLNSSKDDLAKWQSRARDEKVLADAATSKDIAARCRQLELLIAELQAELMAQQDLESKLKATLFRLENTVPLMEVPAPGSTKQADAAISRLENAVNHKAAYAELLSSERDKEQKLANLSEQSAIADELAELKRKLKPAEGDDKPEVKDID
jgi:phage shock protein A